MSQYDMTVWNHDFLSKVNIFWVILKHRTPCQNKNSTPDRERRRRIFVHSVVPGDRHVSERVNRRRTWVSIYFFSTLSVTRLSSWTVPRVSFPNHISISFADSLNREIDRASLACLSYIVSWCPLIFLRDFSMADRWEGRWRRYGTTPAVILILITSKYPEDWQWIRYSARPRIVFENSGPAFQLCVHACNNVLEKANDSYEELPRDWQNHFLTLYCKYWLHIRELAVFEHAVKEPRVETRNEL